MSTTADRLAREARYLAAIEMLADSRVDGAVLWLEADRHDLRHPRWADAPDATIVNVFERAAAMAAGRLNPEAAIKGGGGRHDFVLQGAREHLAAAAIDLVQALMRDPECGRIGWRAILVRIFPGEALRTLHCDPGYDLAEIKGPAVVWVNPYPHDDWRQSQRYPTTELLWSSS